MNLTKFMKAALPPLVLDRKSKTLLLNDAVFYEIIFALGVSINDSSDYCAWEHLNHSRMGHARALIYFFESGKPQRKYSDDLLSEDFGFTAKPFLISPPERDRLNKDLFHLSTRRLRHDSRSKPWTSEPLRCVHERATEFSRHLLSASSAHDYDVDRSCWTILLGILESGEELRLKRPFEGTGVAPCLLLGRGRTLVSGYSELTSPFASANFDH